MVLHSVLQLVDFSKGFLLQHPCQGRMLLDYLPANVESLETARHLTVIVGNHSRNTGGLWFVYTCPRDS